MIGKVVQPDDGTGDGIGRRRVLFEALIEVPDDQRSRWLEQRIADPAERELLLRWLRIDQGSGFLDTPAVERVADLGNDGARAESLIGQQIGAFTLVRVLGSGGMATVFLGLRNNADFEQKVAVKLLRRGLYSELEQRLFQRERRVLAALEHPNIARLIDGGITQAGVPYLVIEYVDGLPITDYANARRLDTVQRLALFISACRAADAAHRSLVVHRDIKPSNILVDSAGEVKLLDFGIAKLVTEDTDDGATVGVFTPNYAAPEQMTGSTVTTATDVYGLGVLLHELLIGQRPDTGSMRRPSSLVSGSSPGGAGGVRLKAQLRRQLRGDLDNILAKALASEPERRYASAGNLADDIVRHLERRPVLAHPPSSVYRLHKFVRRHRIGVAFTVALSLAIAIALGVSLWQTDLARREALRANTVRDFMEDMFEPIESGVIDSKQQSVHDLLVQATTKLENNVELRAAERVDLQLMFSRLHEKVGEPEQAQALAAQAVELAQARLDPDDPLALYAQISQAYSLLEGNKSEAAEPLFKAIESHLRGRHLVQGMPLIRLYDGLADLADQKGDHEHAVQYEQSALSERIEKFGADDRQAATGYNNLAISLDLSGHHDDAIVAFRQAFTIQNTRVGPDSMDTAIARENLGEAELRAGLLSAAQVELLAVERLFDAPPNDRRNRNAYYWQTRCQLAVARNAAHAERECIRSIEQTRALLPTDKARNARALRQEGVRLTEIGRYSEARSKLEEAHDLLGPKSSLYSVGALDYSIAFLDSVEGRDANALSGLDRAIDHVGREYPPYVRLNALALRALLCARSTKATCPVDGIDQARKEMDDEGDRGAALVLPAQIALAQIDLDEGDSVKAARRLDEAVRHAAPEVEEAQIHLLEAHLWLSVAEAAAGACRDSKAQFEGVRATLKSGTGGAELVLANALTKARGAGCSAAP